jgi:lactate 2-monooxygenase
MGKSEFGRERQAAIYKGGIAGRKNKIPVQHHLLYQKASEKMSPDAHSYICGGAGMEKTMSANREAFTRRQIVPRMLNDVSERDLSIELFGKKHPAPFLISPIGVLEMVHPKADLAVAQAAAAEQVPMIFSNQASVDMETCAAAMGDATRWFQLYWSKSDKVVESFVRRAEACHCSAIVVTLDTTLLGWRPRDLDSTYLPFLRAKGIAQYLSDPVFMREAAQIELPDEKRTMNIAVLNALRQMMVKVPGSTSSHLKTKLPMKAVKHFVDTYSRPSLTWENLRFLREITQLPVVLKGIQHPDDAEKALDVGVDGVIVSNHGGRQVDGAIGSLDALPDVVQVIDGKIPVLFDSGIRSGADAFKALALGANAVCIGRPFVYALTIAGKEGVIELLKNYKADLDLTMGLSGCRSVKEIRNIELKKIY